MTKLKDLNAKQNGPFNPFARAGYNTVWTHAIAIISVLWWVAFFLIVHTTASNYIGSDLSLFQSLPEAIQAAVGESANTAPIGASVLLALVCALLPVVPVLVWKMDSAKETRPDLLTIAAYLGLAIAFFAPWIRSVLSIEESGGAAVSLSIKVDGTESGGAGLIMLGCSVLICLYFLFRDRTEKKQA